MLHWWVIGKKRIFFTFDQQFGVTHGRFWTTISSFSLAEIISPSLHISTYITLTISRKTALVLVPQHITHDRQFSHKMNTSHTQNDSFHIMHTCTSVHRTAIIKSATHSGNLRGADYIGCFLIIKSSSRRRLNYSKWKDKTW